MNWKEYLKTQGYTDAEIANMATTFGEEKMAKAFESPMRQAAEATRQFEAAKTEKEEFENFYQNEVLPKVSTVYQDAINARTRAAALEQRLRSAAEFGFLTDPKILDGIVPGVTALPANPVPGSPGGPGPGPGPGSAPGPAAGPSALDPRYVEASKFSEQVNNIPDMLANLTDISNQHFALFGVPLPNVQEIVRKAKDSKGKLNVRTVWESDYKVADKRAEIDRVKAEAHDKQVADEAVRRYASEHNMPFTRPGVPSSAPKFTSTSSDEARHPWKGAPKRKEERRSQFLDAMGKGTSAPAGRVQ